VPVVKAKFSQAGAFYFSGIFNTLTTSTGRFGLKNYYLSGCGYLTGGPFAVAANWRNSGQSLSADSNEYTLTLVGPALGAEYFFYDIDIVNQSPSLTTAP
jgi:hypothetical protein